jgi:transposase-like protein
MSVTITTLVKPSRRPPRVFSLEQKVEILLEAAQSSVHGTAIRHDLSPALVFRWRKRFRQAQPTGNFDQVF